MRKVLAAVVFAIGFSSSSIAAPVTHGALSSYDDGSTEIIKDSLNNLEWLRWDVLAHLTFAETQQAIGSGGAYQGWQIAGMNKAQAFVTAMLYPGSNSCDTSANPDYSACGYTNGTNLNALLGRNYTILSFTNLAWFLSDNQVASEAGILGTNLLENSIRKRNEWGSTGATDFYSDSNPEYEITWLLYRDATVVPLPAALPLLAGGLGILGFMGWRRKRPAQVE